MSRYNRGEPEPVVIFTGAFAELNATFLVNYLSGNGTWNATMTISFVDGSTISGTMSGATIATKEGEAVFGGWNAENAHLSICSGEVL